MTAAINIADLAASAGLAPVSAGRLYHAAGGVFGFDRLRAAAAAIQPSDPYERQALRGLIVELFGEQLLRAGAIAASLATVEAEDVADVDAALEAWIAPRRAAVERARAVISDIEAGGGGWSFAKLTIANAALKEAGGLL